MRFFTFNPILVSSSNTQLQSDLCRLLSSLCVGSWFVAGICGLPTESLIHDYLCRNIQFPSDLSRLLSGFGLVAASVRIYMKPHWSINLQFFHKNILLVNLTAGFIGPLELGGYELNCVKSHGFNFQIRLASHKWSSFLSKIKS